MLVFSYILLVFALGLIIYGLVVRARGIKAVPLYKEDPNVQIKEEDVVSFASRCLLLLGFVIAVISIAMILIGEDKWPIILLTVVFVPFIFYAIKMAPKVYIIPK